VADIIISVDSVSKVFKLPHERYSSLKQNALHLFSKRTYSTLEAVQNVDFVVKRGDFFGIVGRNGSGKSTLLKMLAGIYVPTTGSIQIHGSLSPFIELGVGFNPELTARENVFLNGAILGLSRQQIERKFDDIIGFAELEDFVDQKLKNFSSGMQVRLAFSIAIQAQSDILLIDEVLAVGDVNFQQKCFEVFKTMKREGRTIIFVSHDMESVKSFCNRAILMHHGKLLSEGSVDQIINEYNSLNLLNTEEMLAVTKKDRAINRWGNGEALVEKTTTLLNGKPHEIFRPNERITARLELKAYAKIAKPIVGLIVRNSDGVRVFVANTQLDHVQTPSFDKGEQFTVECTFDNVFSDGSYFISPAIADQTAKIFYDWVEDVCEFQVKDTGTNDGIIQPRHGFKVKV
jgi:ABC-type polysaccharide/polyol phosphate transport system ATPase subunit